VSDPKHEALAKVFVAIPFLVLTPVMALYVISGVWLSAGVIGVALAGVAGGVGLVGPYLAVEGVSEYREVTAA